MLKELSFRTLFLMIFLPLLLSACSQSSAPPLPTRTPLPTFTPTAQVEPTPVDPNAAATARAAEAVAQPVQPVVPVEGQQPVAGGDQPAVQATDTPVPPSPTPAAPQVVVNQNMNVRAGPGTNYTILGTADQGQRYNITGKNQASTWWEVDFNGRSAWLFADLVTAENIQAVAVAANIPAPPTPTPIPPTPIPPPTPVPFVPTPVPQPPTAVPQPTTPPAPKFEFNIAVASRCERQQGGTWFEGKTYKNGNPTNGYRVVFSYEPGGPWVTDPQISGPHDGYTNWDTGYYSHIIAAGTPRAGTWYVWIVDAGGNRISEYGTFTSTGPGDGCNQAVVDFDSR